ncbi:MAG: hypothetical protein VX874_15670 [Pseudomonadota bacterium]|nr:hypothetical protein [Pseudomonadota bacterium]
MPAAKPTAALIQRSIEACRAAGLEVVGVEVKNDGTVRILAPGAQADLSSTPADREKDECDRLFAIDGGKS